ncbi:Uncharacterised protein [Bordetella bronchiseptica]|nr:Uncharacterised protein [Bordetella bronchiseptica]
MGSKRGTRERHSRDNGPIQKRKRPPYPFVLQHLANSSLRRAAALRSTQVVRPVLQQRPSLIQQQRLVVRRPHLVAFHVSKLPLNCIRPVSVLIGPGRKDRPPAMRRRAPSQVHVTHGVGESVGRSEALAAPVWEQIASTTRDALQILQHGNGPCRQRADMVAPRFHLRRRPTPQCILKVELIPLGIRRFLWTAGGQRNQPQTQRRFPDSPGSRATPDRTSGFALASSPPCAR